MLDDVYQDYAPRQGNLPSAPESLTQEHVDSDTIIGTVLKNGRFKCTEPECGAKSFNRRAELKRHYDTTHAAQKPEFWCDVQSCDRNPVSGGKPFHRKYRLQNHMRKMHKHKSGFNFGMTEEPEENDFEDTVADDEL
jgi:hypothetical protein